MGFAEEIEKLNQLRADGAITEDEYQQAKQKLLNEPDPEAAPPPPPPPQAQTQASGPKVMTEQEVKQYCMFIHLSLFAGFLVPMAGLITPIVLWQMKKDEHPEIDQHGKIVTNWLITAIIASVVCFILLFVIIGFFLFFVLGIIAIVYPIVGAVKANNGELWKYPGSIPFFKPE